MTLTDHEGEQLAPRRRLRHWAAGFAVTFAGLGVAGLVDAQLTIESSAADTFSQVMEAPATPVAPTSTSAMPTTTAVVLDQSRILGGPLAADVLLLRTKAAELPLPSTTAVPNSPKTSTSTTAAPSTTAPPTTATPTTAAAPTSTAAPTTVTPSTTALSAATTGAPDTTTTAAPATTVAPETTTTAAPAEPTLGEDDLAQLRACESDGNYQAVNPRGPYLGAYQFLQSTWNWVAGKVGRSDLVGVSPAAASAPDQDAMAIGLWRLAGPGQWPVCGLHLPPKP